MAHNGYSTGGSLRPPTLRLSHAIQPTQEGCGIEIELNTNAIFSQWEAKVHRCQKEFDDISTEVKQEMERFETAKVQELKACVVKHLEDQMAHQLQVSSLFSLTHLRRIL